MNIFVYGTLLRGLCRDSVLAESDYLGLATIQGQLVDLGAYPGLLTGKQKIIGEIYRVDELTLRQLDQIEGFDVHSEVDSLYLRKKTNATLFADGSTIKVEYYLFGDSTSAAEKPIIHDGDYRRYLVEETSRAHWVVAYGSNLDPERLIDRVGAVTEWRVGTLPGFELRYNKQARDSNYSFANISHAANSSTPAVAYRLETDQLKELDHYEGAPTHYCRTVVPFIKMDCEGEPILAHVYIAQPHQLVEGVGPTDDYRGHIQRGYDYHQLTGAV